MIDALINPFDAAVRYLSNKLPVVSRLKSAEWLQVPLGLRHAAQLSATVENAGLMQSIQDKLVEWVTLGRSEPDRSAMDSGKFISELRQLMGAAPGDSHDITDITSERRLKLIWDVQTTDAMEFGRWQIGQDDDLLNAFPAQEFLRVEGRAKPRPNWPSRWVEAGGQFFGGRMIALKTDSVWISMSRFGKPWPPFDFNSGMGVEDVTRREAIKLGLIVPSQTLQSAREDYSKHVAASVEELNPETVQLVQEAFGGQVVIEQGKARWKGI